MSTVRIYKVAELLDTTSQEVLALLKRDHGIELKSASSTIEEVVARSFVERVARQRGISLPGGDMFAEHAASAKGGPKKAQPPKKTEAPKPTVPVLGPPRLVKTVRPVPPPAEAPAAPVPTPPAPAPVAVEQPVVEAPAPPAHVPPPPPPEPEPVPVAASPAPVEEEVAPPPPPPAVEETEPAAVEPSYEPQPVAAQPASSPASGRFVPPTIRLRIEEPGQTPQPARPLTPAKRPQVSQPRMVQPPPATPPVSGSRPGQPASAKSAPAGAQRTGTPGQPRAPYSPLRPTTPSMIGGPRPLPSQPIRTQQPQQARPGMPAQPGQRPPLGQGRPPAGQMRPPAPRPAQPRRERPSAPMAPSMPAAPPPITRTITLAEGMTVKDLADKLDVRVKDVLAKLLMKRMMMTINSTLDVETAKDIAREFGADIEIRSFEEELVAEADESKPEDIKSRAPVVTVMGHVDHGKTSLLDAIRETKVAEREAGGITQHIGAYHVDVGDGRSVVFLDTPGHEAFTLMRARGAKVTDVVVLVVAADDGVMPQTREAIDHARAANVPIVVAINKIDKPGSNPDNVKRELAELNLVPEDWGGQTVMVPVSAKKRQNLDQLLEMILLSTDILELKANPKRSASGAVLEAKLDRGRGPVATVLVQDGTLNVGDNFIAGPVVGKVRALIDDRGRSVKLAGPATPVEVLGLTSLPQPGDPFQTVADAAKARQIATFRQAQAKERALGAKGGRLTLESLKEQIAEGGVKELPLIVKADVQGSAEVLADTLTKLSDDKVKIRIIRSGVGAINESDVLLASASNAIIIGFNVRPDRNAQDTAELEKIDIRLHSVIYNVTEEIKKSMAGLLEPTFKEVRIGTAEVREVFRVPKVGAIAGCMVLDGRITRAGETQARLLRDNVVVFEGKIGSLRRFKDDVSEVKSGFECGIGLQNYNDVKIGDVIEVFAMERVAVTA
ncbi:MAG TPA: translation initiation factor IF-2 [Vicinamibacterales bacterium]